VYHHIYNVTHTYLFVGAALGIWALAIGGLEWAMLGAVIHLSVDRGIFGNVFKPAVLAFEPVASAPDVLVQALSGEHQSRARRSTARMGEAAYHDR
jgi:hypothetical protein